MLKTNVLSQVLIVNMLFAANKIDEVEYLDELIKKYGKLLKTEKLSKSENLKSEKLSKS